MASSGQLQISIVEGRDLMPKPGSPVDPLITLELGRNKDGTDAKAGQAAPKWLKDVKLPLDVEEAATAQLLVSVRDGAKEGEEPFGTTRVPVSEILGGSAVVKWYDLKGKDGQSVGEVCLVLRFVQTPLATPVAATNGSATPPIGLEGGIPTGSEAPKPVPEPANAKVDFKQPPATYVPEPRDKRFDSSTSGSGIGNWAANGTSVILAVGGGIIAVALTSLLFSGKRRQAKTREYVVREGDTFCSIAGCYELPPIVLINANQPEYVDPDKIYPGDKIYIP